LIERHRHFAGIKDHRVGLQIRRRIGRYELHGSDA
jgi:hypothetical protein